MIETREPDFVWDGRPGYRCHRGCGDRFERVGNLEAVVRHEEEAHARPAATARTSSILGADGQPLLVEENAL